MDEMTLVEKYNHELYHSGIKGMKWGVRRYQNPDGSLTAAGKKRYGTKTNFERVKAAKRAAAKANSKEAIAKRKADERTAAEIAKYRKKAGLDPDDTSDAEITRKKLFSKKSTSTEDVETKRTDVDVSKKKVKDMSDDELREATNRWRAEKDYLQAQKELSDVMKKPMSEAEKKKRNVEEAVTQVLTNSLKNIGGQTVTYMMGTAVNKLLADTFNDPQIINPKKGQKDK